MMPITLHNICGCNWRLYTSVTNNSHFVRRVDAVLSSRSDGYAVPNMWIPPTSNIVQRIHYNLMYSVHNYVLQERYFIVCCIVKFHCLKCTKQFEPVIYFEWADLRSPTNKNAPKIQKCAHILLTKRGELWLCISIQKAIQFGVSCIKHQSNAFPIPLLLSQELKYEKTDNCVSLKTKPWISNKI